MLLHVDEAVSGVLMGFEPYSSSIRNQLIEADIPLKSSPTVNLKN